MAPWSPASRPHEGLQMYGFWDVDNEIIQTTYRCVDCDAPIKVNDLVEGRPIEFLTVVPGCPAERVVMISNVVVHRCGAPFLTWALHS
jgi:hypothetical protein